MSSALLPRPLEDYARVVFDCDGVILDSNRLKSEAMGAALVGEPDDRRAAFVAYHRENGGVSRYVKFAHYFEEMFPVSDADARTDEALERYASLVEAGLRECDELPGIRDMLARLNGAGVACFVNSGGDEEEVRAAFRDRDLDAFFVEIFGSPRTKLENLARIDDVDDGAPGLFLGDARSDFEAAWAFNLDFILISAKSEWETGPAFCAARDIPIIETPAAIGTVEPSETAGP